MMNIRELRELTGQTQKEFADRFHIPLGTLRRWEYGESTPAPYIVELIARQLPVKKEYMQKITAETSDVIYYYDKTSSTIMDDKGTRIRITEDLDGVKGPNLVIYVSSLFEAYYEAVAKFERDCRMDKQEDILWG